MSNQQANIGKAIYSVYTKDSSAVLNITDKNTAHTISYQLSIIPSDTSISSSNDKDIEIVIKDFTEDFKQNIINRYKKYQYYYNKYKSYISVQNNLEQSRELYAEDIQERVKAYQEKITLAKSTYPGQFDSSTQAYYNKPIAKYIKKFQDKIDTLHDNYYTYDQTQATYIIDESKIPNEDIINYRDNTIKKKYEGLDSLHILPVVTMPNKALLTNTTHKYAGDERAGRWKAKWVDKQLQYYKRNYYPASIHKSRILFGLVDKTQFALNNENSMLECLYNAIKANSYLKIIVSKEELKKIYSELVLKINAGGDGAFGGRYNIKRYKHYLQGLYGNTDRLTYFKFKYLLVDLNTTRKYICKSSQIFYHFVSPENVIESITIGQYPTKLRYWAYQTFDKSGLHVFGTRADGSIEEVTDQCAFKPFENLYSKTGSLDIHVYFDNGRQVLEASSTIKITIDPLIPSSIIASTYNNSLIDGDIFDKNNIVKNVSVYYEQVSTVRSITDLAKYEPLSSPIDYQKGTQQTCKITYIENNKDVSTIINYNVIQPNLKSIQIANEPSKLLYKVNTILTDSDINDTKFNIIYNECIKNNVSFISGNQEDFPRFDYNVLNGKTIQSIDTSIKFTYYCKSNGTIQKASVTQPISIAKPSTIVITQFPKTDYNDGDYINFNGLKFNLVYTNGDIETYEYNSQIAANLSYTFKTQSKENPSNIHYEDDYIQIIYKEVFYNYQISTTKITDITVSSIVVNEYYEKDVFTYSSKLNKAQSVLLNVYANKKYNGQVERIQKESVNLDSNGVSYDLKNKELTIDNNTVTFSYKGCYASSNIVVYALSNTLNAYINIKGISKYINDVTLNIKGNTFYPAACNGKWIHIDINKINPNNDITTMAIPISIIINNEAFNKTTSSIYIRAYDHSGYFCNGTIHRRSKISGITTFETEANLVIDSNYRYIIYVDFGIEVTGDIS